MLKQEAFQAILNLNTLGGTQIQLKSASYQEGFVEGKVVDLVLTGVGDLANIIDCYESTGIWTTGCTTLISRDNLGTTEYKVNGRVDEDNNVWVVDIGTICLLTGKVAYFDTLLPIDRFSKFKSRVALPAGLKVAVLKKITATECIEVDIAYGSLQNGQILRTYPKLNLEFTAEDQALDLEQLCVGLIPLILSNYQYSSDNLIQFSNLLTLDPYKENILVTTLNKLVELIDTVSNTNRIGSIPQTITTYLTSEHIYGTQADYNRANQTITISECIDLDCLPTVTNLLLTSRAVSNKAVAWVLYVLCLYSKTRQVITYDNSINLIAEYLKDQVNYSENLIKVGWTSNAVYEESEQIETLNFDTSAITSIAFLKLFELKGGITYLDLSTDLYTSIYLNFYRGDFFVQLKEAETPTLESLTYGLIFTEFFKDYEQQNQLKLHFDTLILPNYGQDKERFVLVSNALVPITGGYQFETYNLITEENLTSNSYDLSYFTFGYASQDLTQVSFYCSLVDQFLIRGSSFQLEEVLNTFRTTVEAIDVTGNLFYYSNSLLEDAFYNYDLTFIPSELVKESAFTKSRILSKLKSWIPTEFNWFSKVALESGNTSSILKVLANLTAGVTTQLNLGARSLLNKHGIELPGFLTKTQLNYISSRPEGSLSGFNFLKFLGIPTVVKEPYKEVLGFAGSEQVFNSNLGFGYLSGNTYSPGVCKVLIGQPIDASNEKLIEAVQAPGIRYEIIQSIPLLIPNLLVEDINVVAIENTTCTIITSNEEYIEAGTSVVSGCSTEIQVTTWRVNNTDRFNNTDRIDA